jgi:hypothetical protein
MKSQLRFAVALAAVTALLSGITLQSAGANEANNRWPTYGPIYVLNPSGGMTGSDGLRITFGGSQLAVQRRDSPIFPGLPNSETYNPNATPGMYRSDGIFNFIGLAVGDSANGGTALVAPPFVGGTKFRYASNVNVLPWTVTATATADQIISTLTGVVDGLTYTVVVTVGYVSPEDRSKISYQVEVPAGNTKPVRLYHLIDTYLGGSDQGPGFFTDPVSCGVNGESGAIVGVDRADNGIVEAFQYISGTPWTSYMSGYYQDVVFGSGRKTNPDANDTGIGTGTGPQFGPGFMNDLNNQVITDPRNDNGIGIGWNFGSTPGIYGSVAKLIFSSASIEPCLDAEAVSVTNPDPGEVPDAIVDPIAPDPAVDEVKDEPLVEVARPAFTG